MATQANKTFFESIEEQIIAVPQSKLWSSYMIKDDQQLLKFVRTLNDNLLWLCCVNPNIPFPPFPSFQYMIEEEPVSLAASYIRAEIEYNDKAYKGLVLISAGILTATRLLKEWGLTVRTDQIIKVTPKANLPSSAGWTSVLEGFAIPKIVVIIAHSTGIKYLMPQPNVPQDTKVLSAAFSAFPWIQSRLRDQYNVIKDNHPDVTNILGIRMPPAKTTSFSALEVMCAYTLALLGPTYSRDDMYKSQIRTRLSAVAAGITSGSVDLQQAESIINGFAWDPKIHSGAIDEVMGYVLCIDKDLDYDPEIQEENLCPLRTIQNECYDSEFFKSLVVQMRLVYRNHNSSSIRFGMNVIPVIKKDVKALPQVFGTELDALEERTKQLITRPYINLVCTVDPKNQVSTYKHVVYAGLLFHGKNLSDEADRKEWEKYNVEAIAKTLDRSDVRAVIATVVDNLPRLSVDALAKYIAKKTNSDAELVLENKPTDLIDQVFTICLGFDEPGEWAKSRQSTLAKTQYNKFMTEASDLVKKLVKDKHADMITRTVSILDLADRQSAVQSENDW